MKKCDAEIIADAMRLANAASRMRAHQRAWFRTKDRGELVRAKQAEAEVDRLIIDFEEATGQRPSQGEFPF